VGEHGGVQGHAPHKWAIAGLATIVIAVVPGVLSSVLGGMAASNG
jgi:hypothetical protein